MIDQFAVPEKSANYTPKFNTSIQLPEDFEKEVEKIANESNTYYQAAAAIALFVDETIKTDEKVDYDDAPWIRKELNSHHMPENYTEYIVNETVKNGKGNKYYKALVAATALQHIGIKARAVIGFLPGKTFPDGANKYDIVRRRAWIQYYDPDAGWVNVGITMNRHTKTFEVGAIPIMYVYNNKKAYVASYIYQNFYLFDPTITPLRLDLKKTKNAKIWFMGFFGKRYIYAEGTGLLIVRKYKTEVHHKNNTITYEEHYKVYYVPANTLVVTDASSHFSFEDHVRMTLLPPKAFQSPRVEIFDS